MDSTVSPDPFEAAIVAIEEKLQQVHEKRRGYRELKDQIIALNQMKTESFKSMVDMGSGVYCRVKVPDSSKMFVSIGGEVHVEMTKDEAFSFAKDMELRLNMKSSMLLADLAKVRADQRYADLLLNSLSASKG